MYDIPKKREIPEPKRNMIFAVDFEAGIWNGTGCFKLLFSSMDE
jgi:hypothetical protein